MTKPLRHLLRTSSAITGSCSRSAAIRTCSRLGSSGSDDGGRKEGFFGNFFDRPSVEAQKTAHSTKLAARDEVLELQTHNVRPDCQVQYLAAHKNLSAYVTANQEDLHCQALGHFRVLVGDEDQYIHLWKYEEGYAGMDKTFAKLRYYFGVLECFCVALIALVG